MSNMKQNSIFDILGSDKPIIEGVELVDKQAFYEFDFQHFNEVTKGENIYLKDGLDTYIIYVKYKDVSYDYYAVIEGITGTKLSHCPVSYKETKKEAKKRAISKARETIKVLEEKGVLEETIHRIACNITGLSPRYKGKLPDFTFEPHQLEVGDQISDIRIRGGISYNVCTVIAKHKNSYELKHNDLGNTFHSSFNEVKCYETTNHAKFIGYYKYLQNYVSVNEIYEYWDKNLIADGFDLSSKIVIFLAKQINLVLNGQSELLIKNIQNIYMRGWYNDTLINTFEHFTDIKIPKTKEFDIGAFKTLIKAAVNKDDSIQIIDSSETFRNEDLSARQLQLVI